MKEHSEQSWSWGNPEFGAAVLVFNRRKQGWQQAASPWGAAAGGIWALKRIIVQDNLQNFFPELGWPRKSGQIFSKYFYCQTIYEYYLYFRTLGNSTQLTPLNPPIKGYLGPQIQSQIKLSLLMVCAYREYFGDNCCFLKCFLWFRGAEDWVFKTFSNLRAPPALEPGWERGKEEKGM